MWRAYRSEWPKLRRRSVLLVFVAMVAISAIALYVGIARIPKRANAFELTLALSLSTGLVGVLQRSALLIAVLAINTVAALLGAEWSQGTLRNMLAQEPGRLRLLAGKVMALTTYILISAAVAMAVAIAIAAYTAPGIGASTASWWSSDGLTALAEFLGNLALAIVAWCVFGMFVAVLVRNPAGAVGGALAWLVVVEGLVTSVWPEVGQWLPGHLLGTLIAGGTTAISYTTALLVSALYTAGMAGIAGFIFVRRDVLA